MGSMNFAFVWLKMGPYLLNFVMEYIETIVMKSSDIITKHLKVLGKSVHVGG